MASLASSAPATAVHKRSLPKWDWPLFLLMAILIVIGLMCIYSEGHGRGNLLNFQRQVINTGIGLIPMAIMLLVNPNWWRKLANWIYGLTLLLLSATLFLGKDTKGAQRWIEIGPMQFQPSEFAKLFIVLTLATYYANRVETIRSLRTFLFSLLHLLPLAALTFIQPHLGATLVLIVTWFAISLVAGVPTKYFASSVALMAVLGGLLFAVPAVSKHVLQDYQRERIEGLLTKNKEKQGANWQTHRAAIAFGVGGVTGVGFLNGEQKKKGYIPEQRNDFVFTVIGEEGGLVAGALVVGLFAAFYWRIYGVMVAASDPYLRMITAGVFAMLGFHTFVNMAMVLQVIPVVGLWLPFMSSGGTAIWLCMAAVGLVMNVRAREKPLLF